MKKSVRNQYIIENGKIRFLNKPGQVNNPSVCAINKNKVEKTKRLSVKEGCAYSIMDGFGLNYITPFAVEIGKTNPFTNTFISLLSSIPSLLGNFSQLITVKAMNYWSRQKIVFWGVLFQAIMWLSLITIAALYFVFNINSTLALSLLVIFYALLNVSGSIAGPAWSSWMKDLITEKSGEYFGTRNKIAGIVSLVCMLLAGFILDYFKAKTLSIYLFAGFGILFFFAFIGRSISAYLITKHYEPCLSTEKSHYFTLSQFLRKMWHNNFGKFTLYISLVSFAAAIASPFFTVYMLKNLGFNYIQYIATTLASAIMTLLFMPAWGKIADKVGNIKIIKITGFFVALVPLFYLLSWPAYLYWPKSVFPILIVTQLFSGFIWAGFNLSAGNFIYDAVTRQRIAICVAYYGIVNGIGVFIGATLGGIVASLNFTLFGLYPILVVFLISAIARFLVPLFMISKIKEVRNNVQEFDIKSATKEFSKASPTHILNDIQFRIFKSRPVDLGS